MQLHIMREGQYCQHFNPFEITNYARKILTFVLATRLIYALRERFEHLTLFALATQLHEPESRYILTLLLLTRRILVQLRV